MEISYSLVDVFEFWEYSVMCFDKGTNSGGLFEENVNMFLKLKQESSGYPSYVQSEEDKDKYIEDYRRAERIALDKSSIFNNARQRTLEEVEIKLNVGQISSEPKQDPDNPCDIGESFLHKLLTSPCTEVTNLIFRKDEVAWVFRKYSDENLAAE